MSKVGTLDTLGLAVYERANGTFFYNDPGRIDVHGNQKWTRTDGHAMKGQHRDTGAKTAAKTTAPAAKSGNNKVGTLDTLGLAVYERADGSFYYNDPGRVDVHGNQKWTATNGHAMKGQHRDTGAKTAAKTTAPAAKMTAPAAKATNKGAMGGVFKMPEMAVEFAPFGAPKPKLESGSIKAWLDERGFGFIRPDHGDDDVFCHRTAIVGADSLPTGTRVTYKLEHNPHRPGTYLAADVTALGAKPVPQPSAGKVLHHLPEAAVNQKGGKKVALVVGISRYRSCPLKNPVNDANAVARKLKSMGFTVTVLLDCPEPVLSKAVRTFTDSLSKSVSAAVFFFAGHGCEYQNQNFLMTTTECPDERDLPRKAVSAHEVQRDMEDSGCVFPVLILDCCRVFEGMARGTRAPPKGMVEMVPKGSYVALACAPNTCAEDGTGVNGTFTAALLKHIGTPGKDIDFILSEVRADVESETNGRQRPWSNHQLRVRPACLF